MASQRRVRVVHHVWRLSRGGGIPIVVRSLLEGLDPQRFEQHVISHRPLLQEDGLTDLAAHATFHSLGVVGPQSPLRRLHALVTLTALLRRLSPDVIHTHSGIAANVVPWALLRRGRLTCVLDVHDDAASHRVSALTNRVEDEAVRRLRFQPIAHSSVVRRELEGRTGSMVRLVPLGVDVGRFRPDDARRDQWRQQHGFEGRIVVLYVARVVPSKNVGLFLDVAEDVTSDHPDAMFVVVGGGDTDGAEDMVRERGLADRVRILGHVADLPSAYAGADLFLSTSDYEGFGIALVEAMASGLPVVSTAVGGVVDVVDAGVSGVLADRGDRHALAKAVGDLVGDRERRAALGNAGRRRAEERFSVPTFVGGVGALYTELTR